jgi:hypothetical protein
MMSALHQPQGVAEKPSPIKGGGRTTAPPVSSSAALSYPERIMSAFTPIADSTRTSREVRFGPIACARDASSALKVTNETPGVQTSSAPVPPVPDVARAELGATPVLESKLPPSTADSTPIVVGRERSERVTSRPALELSATGGPQPPLQERSPARQLSLTKSLHSSAAAVIFSRTAILPRRACYSGVPPRQAALMPR